MTGPGLPAPGQEAEWQPRLAPEALFGWALAAALAAAALFRVAAVLTENVNWDEFALLQRALMTLERGELQAGGRPGLGTLALVPFVAECVNAVDTLRDARWVWTVFVLLSALAFWVLLRQVLEGTQHAKLGATLGLALWTLPPPFLLYSVQVRTDQPAILCGLVGGLALLRSRHRAGWALAAGGIFGVGFLFTQKLLYVGALVALLSLFGQMKDGEWKWRREARRGLLVVAGAAAVLASYRAAATAISGPADLLQLQSGLSSFAQYREWVGWENYTWMLPLLVPHMLLLALLPLVTRRWRVGRGSRVDGWMILAAWTVIGLGAFITLFHAGRFPYFFMVLGLFPAVAGALVLGPALSHFHALPYRAILFSGVGIPLVGFGLLQGVLSRADTQSHQRQSLAFVDRNFGPQVRGFSERSEFVCRRDPDPFPTRFHSHVLSQFAGDEGEARARELIEEFRDRQVAFMILPRGRPPYPDFLWEFWTSNYVPYAGAIRVAGRRVEGGAGVSRAMEVIVAGSYTWRPEGGGQAPLMVEDHLLRAGDELELDASEVLTLTLPEGGEGILVLALDEAPTEPAGFYRSLGPLSGPLDP